MRHLLQCRHGIPISGWTKRSVWEDFHAFLARSSAACALRRGGGVGLRDDRCRCPRRSRRKLRQPRLANLLRAAVDDDIAGRAADRAQHDAAGAAGRRVRATPADIVAHGRLLQSAGLSRRPVHRFPGRRLARHAVRPWFPGRPRRLRLDARPIAADRPHRDRRLSGVDVVAAPQPARARQRPGIARLRLRRRASADGVRWRRSRVACARIRHRRSRAHAG